MYDSIRSRWAPSWKPFGCWTGFHHDETAPVRVDVLHAGRLDGVAGEVDAGMRALFDQEEWLGVDSGSTARRALGQACEAMAFPPPRSAEAGRAAAADTARRVLGGAVPALEAGEAVAMRERDEQRAGEGAALADGALPLEVESSEDEADAASATAQDAGGGAGRAQAAAA